MHLTQRRILEHARYNSLSSKTLREIGEAIGESHPQKVKHHLEQLIKNGFLERKGNGGLFVVGGDLVVNTETTLLPVPILGAGNCGPALMMAEENIEGYLKVSSKLLPSNHRVFALKAVGNSMNMARVKGTNISDGDYVLVDPEDTSAGSGDYVLSVIDGLANIKKLYIDKNQQLISLLSESTHNIPPIVLDPEEANYFLNGKIVRVIKTTEPSSAAPLPV